MNHFQEMGLPHNLLTTLEQMQFSKPTPIQAEAIPAALQGHDILGSAQTGTGKTAAFGIPLVTKLSTTPGSAALIMTPTRELASQVMAQLRALLGKGSAIPTALLIGGDSMHRQLMDLRRKPRLVVGTPGRINDHLNRRSLNLSSTNFLVLDETDRMLDMGFTVQIEKILHYLAAERQTLLFSATMPKNIERLASKYLTNPVRVNVSGSSAPAANIQQHTRRVREADKYDALTHELNDREGSIIVFVKTKHGTEKMAAKLVKAGYSADAIHGDLRQSKRERVLRAFRHKRYRILVATDVAARGLDIPHIEHVINYDLPQCPEDYVHRIGRTARAGLTGAALNLVAPADKAKWAAIDRYLNPKAHAAKTKAHGRHQCKSKRKPVAHNGFRGKKRHAIKAKQVA